MSGEGPNLSDQDPGKGRVRNASGRKKGQDQGDKKVVLRFQMKPKSSTRQHWAGHAWRWKRKMRSRE